MNLKQKLLEPIDNSALVVFRVLFGLLITIEAWGAIGTGWVRRTLVEPDFTFNFIGFDFLQTFPGTGPQMYAWFVIMGCFGAMVMLGYRYRLAIIGYAVMWSSVYLMQKSSYNNHYYLLMLLLWFFAFLPAHRAISIDAIRKPSLKSIHMPRWVMIFIIAQLLIVYTYASIAKMYPDWIDGTVPRILMRQKKDYWLVGELLQKEWTHYVMAYFGILFDGLIIPALLWRPTRKAAFILSIFFHLFNSFVFQVGIFPYMSLGFCLFFFPTKTIHNIFLKRWKTYFDKSDSAHGEIVSRYNTRWTHLGLTAAAIYLIIQAVLPLRQHYFQDNVLWTEEGHRLSWRMMLRTKSGNVYFMAEDKNTGERWRISHKDYLSKKQQRIVVAKPDAIWQFAQIVKKDYASKGQDIAVYAFAKVSVNGRKRRELTDSKIDIASLPWQPLQHTSWVLDSGDYLEK